ncbi:type II secretion system secretin GspD [Thermodesulfobacteriota bacterium]
MKINKYLIISILITFLLFSQAVQGARLSGDEEIKSAPEEKPSTLPAAVSNRDSAGQSGNNKESRYVTIDFDDVDIALFIKFISELTEKNFLIDNNVKGKVTIISPTKITVDEAYRVFESVLEVNGFTTVESGSIIKIVPAMDARSKDIETRFQKDSGVPEDRVVTQLIPLKHASPGELQKILSSFISKTSVMASYEPTSMLIVTDVLSNITRLMEIVEALDIPGTGEEITVLPLKHANAPKIASSLNTVFKTLVQPGRNKIPTSPSPNVIIVPDERTNTLIIIASEVDTLKVRELVNLLDKVIPKGDSDIHVYYLQNANAEELSSVLTSIPTNESPKNKQGIAPVLSSKDIQIVADKPTNSLIITAGKDDYAILEEVIKKLDIPRRMVYIEALVMEVSMSSELELGVQMLGGDMGQDVSVFGGSTPGGNNFPSVDTTTGTVNLPTGLTLGVLGNTITIGDLTFPDIGAVVRAYATDSDLQILSTPQIMTIDNEEAEIKVVDKVPFISRLDTTNTGSGIAYSNYDFEEVGVILNITPQINQERFVRLKISQEVSQIVSKDVNNQPTTLKRQANTTVTIRDGQTIVIGGLIDEKDNSTNYRVPWLSRIPILGYLFRSKTKSLDKKNLYIFITPHIIENPEEANVMYEDKKGHIDTIKEGVIRMNNGGYTSKDMRLTNLGYNYLRLKEYNKALDYYNEALEINPENPFALLNIGYIHQVRGDSKKAMEMYEKLIALDPDDRVTRSTDPRQAGKKLTDIAKNNLKTLEIDEQ